MGLDVPEPLKREHEELHKELRRAVQAGGRTGETAVRWLSGCTHTS
jgi:hypothetical protein